MPLWKAGAIVQQVGHCLACDDQNSIPGIAHGL